MPIGKRATTKRRAALRPETLAQEAKTWHRAASQARDPGSKQEFEEMAVDRELVAAALEELERDPPEDSDGDKRPKSRSSKQ